MNRRHPGRRLRYEDDSPAATYHSDFAAATYCASGLRDGQGLAALPILGPRIDAVTRAPAIWFHHDFVHGAADAHCSAAIEQFYNAVVPFPVFTTSLHVHLTRVRRGIGHLLDSSDAVAVKFHRCLAGVYASPGLGTAFWSAVAQALDPLRFPSWTAAIVDGARRLGLIQRRRIWYGDLLTAYARLRAHEPRMTAAHVDHFLTLVSQERIPDLDGGTALHDPLPDLIAQERQSLPLTQRLAMHEACMSSAREWLEAALRAENAPAVLTALESIDSRLSPSARAWDATALMQWLAWIWNDDDPIAELTACERESAGTSRCLTAAILHLRMPMQFPLWDRDAASGLSRFAEVRVDNYPLYAEGVGRLAKRYELHPLEAVAVLARSEKAHEHRVRRP